MEKEVGIGRIKYAEIHRYYPIKIDSKMSKRNIKEKLEKASFCCTESLKTDLINGERKQVELFSEILDKLMPEDLSLSDDFLREIDKLDKNYSYKIENRDGTINITIAASKYAATPTSAF